MSAMSGLLGRPGDRWPLPAAVDDLASSARWAGIPGLIWFAGIWYPSLNVNVEFLQAVFGLLERTTGAELPEFLAPAEPTMFVPLMPTLVLSPGNLAEMAGMTLLLLLPVLILYRLHVGLAFVSAPGVPLRDEQGRRTRTLSGAWRAGRKLGLTAFGMWVTLMALMMGALAFLVGPLVILVGLLHLREIEPFLFGLIVPTVVMLLGYGVILQVVNQLALHSLANNRRGVVSALTHAWRLIRNDPWGAVRAALIDIFLFVLVALVAVTAGRTLAIVFAETGLAWLLTVVVSYALLGFVGTTRAAFWARAYRALGGLSPADRVPGLGGPFEPAPKPAAEE
ncbi:MAG: hypothetical protein O7B99_03830 [Planctomycetota bacterium]|nr:hypothetical protein [Planctomycetota bacterium]